MKSQIAVIVPVSGAAAESEIGSVQVWSQASEAVKPALGRFCSRFYPASEAWGCEIHNPFGVVFGKQSPEKFLAIYLAALQAQRRAIRFHLECLFTAEDLDNAKKNGGALLCAIEIDAKDEERAAHAVWYMCMQKGVLFPDCGVYYADLKRALITRVQERAILENPAGYALGVVAVEFWEEEND